MTGLSRLFIKAKQLWNTSPRWKWTVISSSALTIALVVTHAGTQGAATGQSLQAPQTNSSTPTSVYTPPSQADQQSDQNLSEFQTAYDANKNIAADGARCEQIVEVFNRLSNFDVNRGKTIQKRKSSIEDAQKCQRKVQESDIRINAVQSAVARASQTQSVANYKVATESVSRLDSFDRSRSRFTNIADLVEQVKSFDSQILASDARIDVVVKKYRKAIADSDPLNQADLSKTYEQLSTMDRTRLRDEQPNIYAAAEKASLAVQNFQNRFHSLQSQFELVEKSATEKNVEELISQVSQIDQFDLAIASGEQIEIYKKSKTKINSFGWKNLEDKLADYRQNPTPKAADAVAYMVKLMKNFESDNLTAQQQSLLSVCTVVANNIIQSDNRISKMIDSANEWKKYGKSVGIKALNDYYNITDFDKLRFNPEAEQAWNQLKIAELIFKAPKVGLSGATKSEIKVFVQSNSFSSDDKIITDTLKYRLKKIGLNIVDNSGDAALKILVDVKNITPPERDFSGVFTSFVATTTLQVNASWLSDDSIMLSDAFVAIGRGDQKIEAKQSSLSNAIDKIVAKFNDIVR